MNARRRTWRIKWWAWVIMLAIGLAAVAAGLGWFLFIAVGLAWATVGLVACTRDQAPPELDAQELVSDSSNGARSAIRRASSEQLCTLWLQTGHEMKHAYLPTSVCSYAELRQAILDELMERDPDGVNRWLRDQPDRRDPRSYLRDHQS